MQATLIDNGTGRTIRTLRAQDYTEAQDRVDTFLTEWSDGSHTRYGEIPAEVLVVYSVGSRNISVEVRN